jgi:succinyl-CoA synthetase beta subunit
VKLYEYEAKKIFMDNGIPGDKYPREVEDITLELLK